MSTQLHAKNLFEHLRHICERPKMFAPDFEIDHLLMFIYGYEAALSDAKQPSQHDHFREWIYQRHPEWRNSPMSWPRHVLVDKGDDLDKALDAIIALLNEFPSRED
ncbi:hypothetical protein [Pyxidicoccus xibeiensis]|uniref:hypothetical protein n=1 Tax=Pyxidicoccus xibeiensis TaxID=2906759 RepID=UPI0020A83795|nr:hypothetical protein [Pyxidicoccus xibeiensis]MCP3138048.1 hypothetical protein [Pyxidicoccus xibeiensis]